MNDHLAINTNAALYLTGEFKEAFDQYRQSIHPNPAAGVKALQQVLPRLNKLTDAPAVAHVLLALGYCYKMLNDYHLALKHFSQAAEIAKEKQTDWIYAEALEEAQFACNALNMTETAFMYAQELNHWLKQQLHKQHTKPDINQPTPSQTTEQQIAELQLLAQVIAHDLKEPLHLAGSFTSLIQYKHGHTFNPELKEFFAHVLGNVSQMHRKLEDLGHYVHISTQPDMDFFPLQTAITKALNMLAPRIKEQNAQIEILIPPNSYIFANKQMVIALLYRLTDNALKFIRPNSTPVITISLQLEPQHVLLSVTDNGLGIPPAYAEHVFNIFYRFHQHEQGTGMGLAVCKKIALAHGGKIWATPAQQQQGTTFYCQLPLPG